MSMSTIQSEVTPAPSPIPSVLHSEPSIVTPTLTPTQLNHPVPIQQNPTSHLQFPNLQYKATTTTATTNLNKKPKKSKSKEKASQGTQGENTGRWTQEEHRLFLQGLEEHGKGWKKIASLIKSRTVVQIRTHAQKYFQKLAKARHNGEEGDVSMEGRGVVSLPSPAPVLAQPVVKRRRQVSGNKRKGLGDVVESVQKEKKKDGRLPVVSPVLAPYLTEEDVSSSVLEDSLYRFLTPSATNFLPVSTSEHVSYHSISPPPNETVSTVSITLPSKGVLSGETSPTGVLEVDKMPEVFQSEIPTWFAKGSDVDELLNEAEALDWLADPGDLVENYIPPPEETETTVADPLPESLPPVVSYNSISMNELPSLFDTEDIHTQPNKRLKLSSNNLFSIQESATNPTEEFGVFDTSFDEQAFVSALLDSNDPTALLT